MATLTISEPVVLGCGDCDSGYYVETGADHATCAACRKCDSPSGHSRSLSVWEPVRLEVVTMAQLLSVVTDDGTAMSEATLCAAHHADATLRGYAELVARGADDLTGPPAWKDSTGNEVVECVECGTVGEW